MTSKTSSLHDIDIKDLQIQLGKRRLWLSAVTVLMFVCYYILGTILYLARGRSLYRMWYTNDPSWSFKAYMTDYTAQWLGVGSMIYVMTIILAVVSAFCAFVFLYKTQAVDFYFSHPITRRAMFLNIYLNSLVTYVALTVVFTLIAMGIAGVMGAASVAVTGEILVNLIRNLILFFALYSVVVLAVLISRCHLMAVIMTTLFLFGDMIISFIIKALMSTYYATYYDTFWILGASRTYKPHIFSPVLNFVHGASAIDDSGRIIANIIKYDLCTLLFGTAAFALAYYVFKNRKAEDIGPGLVSGYIRDVSKFIVAVMMAVSGAALADTVLENSFGPIRFMPVIMILFMAAIVCIVTEMICAGRLKAGLKRLWQIVPVALCALLMFTVFKKDLFGYDRYVPNPDKVESCALFTPYSINEFRDENGNYLDAQAYFATEMKLEDAGDVIEIAKVGQERQRDNYKAQYYAQHDLYIPDEYNSDSIWDTSSAIVAYHMKNGDYVVRYLAIPGDIDKGLMDRVVGSDEYKRCVYATKKAAENAMSKCNSGTLSYEVSYTSGTASVSSGDFAKLMDAYSKDLEHYDYSFASTNKTVGMITFSSDYSSSYQDSFSYRYEVYDDYENTIECLKQLGIYVEPKPDADTITNADLYMVVYDESGQNNIYDCEYETDDEEEIARLLPLFGSTMEGYWAPYVSGSVVNGTFSMDTWNEGGYMSEYYGSVPADELPDDIRAKLEDNIVWYPN